jgi:hypothetical protein
MYRTGVLTEAGTAYSCRPGVVVQDVFKKKKKKEEEKRKKEVVLVISLRVPI